MLRGPMKPSLRPLLGSLLALAAACGGNVVVDHAGGGGAGGSAGAGGATSTTSTSTSTSTTSTSTSTSTSTTSTSTTTSGSVGGCTGGQDAEIIVNKPVWKELVGCGMMFVGAEPAQLQCVEAQTGLSPDCAGCADAYLTCNIKLCLNPCLNDPGGMLCLSCREMQCDPAFFACSGLSVHPGPP
jgi:hypothetical protein